MFLTWKCLLFLSCFLTTFSKHFLIETEDNVTTSNTNANSIEENEYDYDDEDEDYDDYSFPDSYDFYDYYDYDYDYDPNAIESKILKKNAKGKGWGKMTLILINIFDYPSQQSFLKIFENVQKCSIHIFN